MATTRKKKRRNNQKRGGGLGRFLGLLLCFVLGLIIGFGGFAGGIVGIGAYLYKQPVDKTIETIEQYIPVDIYGALFGKDDKEGYINEKYASMKITDLLGDSFKAIGSLADGGSLSDLNEVSPKIGAFVDKLLKKTDKYAIPLDKDTLMSTTLSKLPKYLGNSVKEIPLGDLLDTFDVMDTTPLLMAISYGEEGIDYMVDANGDVIMLGNAKKTTINDLLSGGFDSLLDKLTVDSIMPIDTSNSMMCTLAYGSSNRYTVDSEGNVQMTQVTYVYADRGEGYKLYDDKNEVVAATVETLTANTLKITFDNGETQYVSLNAENTGLAFYDEALTTPVNYKKVKISDLTGDALALIDDIYLKDALNIDANAHKVLITLAYGSEGVDFRYVGEGADKTIEMIGTATPRTIGELRNSGTNLINDIPLSDVMSANPDEVLIMYLLYGREGIHYTVNASGEIVMLQKQIAIRNNTAYNEYGEELSDYTLDTANSRFTFGGKEYNYVSSGLTLETADGTADIYYLTDLAGNEIYFTSTKLGDLMSGDLVSSLTNRLTLKDVVGEDAVNSNTFFKHLQNETITSLPNAINGLTLLQVYEDKIYRMDANGNYLDKNGNVTLDKSEALNHEWWYLLHNKAACEAEHVGCDKSCVHDYSITELGSLIGNMRTNVEEATLQDLKDDGMIEGLDDSTLNAEIKKTVTVPMVGTITIFDTEKTHLGELTVVELLSYVGKLIPYMQ